MYHLKGTILIRSVADVSYVAFRPNRAWQVVNELGTKLSLSLTSAQRHAAQELNWEADR